MRFVPSGLSSIAAWLAIFFLVAPLGTAHAASIASEWAAEEQTSVRLIAARDGLDENGEVRAGLEFRMQPGWKVYWRSPGDAGFPPIPEFDGSTNAVAGPFAWPTPERFSVLGLETLGYEDQVVLPFTLTAPDPSQTAWLAATVRYLTCNDICIPYEANLSLEVPPGGGTPTDLAHTIGKFDAQVPKSADAARLDVSGLWAEATENALYLTAKATSDIPFVRPDLFLEGPRDLGFGPPDIAMSADGQTATLRVAVSGYDGAPVEAANSLSGTPFILTLRDGPRAAEINTEIGAPLNGPVIDGQPQGGASSAILVMLSLAFLGGLILNLMPCVLPVLSLKILSLAKLGGASPAAARASFLATAAGILFAFLSLGLALLALKSTGATIGWGIQFQQLWFLVAMAVLVTLFACNLWGFFDVRLPQALAAAGQRAGGGPGLGGSFGQGVFATLLATPCSAPFLGTAVGFALARGPMEILAIFTALGVGLATPYIIVAAAPQLAALLPKPGQWMVKLRFALGLALASTAVWLLTVIDGAAGTSTALVVGVLLLALIAWMAFAGRALAVPSLAKTAGVVLVSAGAVAGAYQLKSTPASLANSPSTAVITWQAFDPGEIPEMVANGKVVFVDVTADWCITCQVNKRLVLEKEPIKSLLDRPDVIAMQADWTRPDPEIAAYLASFGRYGIPFNAIYGPDARTGVALPELLSEGTVLNTFRDVAPAQMAKRPAIN